MTGLDCLENLCFAIVQAVLFDTLICTVRNQGRRLRFHDDRLLRIERELHGDWRDLLEVNLGRR